MKCICIWKTYERAGEEEEAEKVTQKRKTKLESQRENLWEPKLKSRKMRRRRRLHWLAAESGKTWLKVVEHATETEAERGREKGKRGRAGRERRKQKCGCCLRRRRGNNNNVDYLNVAADGYTQHSNECVYLCVCLVCPNIDLSHGQGDRDDAVADDDDAAEIIRSCCSCGKNWAHYAANKLNEMRVKLPAQWLIDWTADWLTDRARN